MRGDTSIKRVSLVFTGHDRSEGTMHILQELRKNHVKGSFFLTGDYMRNPRFQPFIKQIIKGKHYLSVHSDKHILTNDWTDRNQLLVTKDSFLHDLNRNYLELEQWNIKRGDAQIYIPSYEWYNKQTVAWAKELGVIPINYSPGLRTAADYTYPQMGNRYWSSESILKDFWSVEEKQGLNGFIILIHMGTDERRKDKFYRYLDEIISGLKKKKYQFVDVLQLLK